MLKTNRYAEDRVKRIRHILVTAYGCFAFILMAIGFAGLFSRRIGYRMPVVTTDILPVLDRYAVWGETLRGPAILVGGEEWFFLVMVGLVILGGIATALIYGLLKSVAPPS